MSFTPGWDIFNVSMIRGHSHKVCDDAIYVNDVIMNFLKIVFVHLRKSEFELIIFRSLFNFKKGRKTHEFFFFCR